MQVGTEDNKNVYVNEEGDWKKIDLLKVHLNSGTWKDNILIGINTNKSSISNSFVTQSELDSLLNFTPHDPRDLSLPDGTRIKLEPDVGTSMKITLPGQEEKTEWTGGLENCHSLVLSPDKKYILFECLIIIMIINIFEKIRYSSRVSKYGIQNGLHFN